MPSKAITVTHHPASVTKPSRYVASDSDGNRAGSGASARAAVLALCEAMRWTGELIQGQVDKDHEVFVWATGPRLKIAPPKPKPVKKALTLVLDRNRTCAEIETLKLRGYNGKQYAAIDEFESDYGCIFDERVIIDELPQGGSYSVYRNAFEYCEDDPIATLEATEVTEAREEANNA